MTDMTPFEQRLSVRLGRELAASVRPFDPAEVAAGAIASPSTRDRVLNGLRFGPLPLRPTVRNATLLGVTALVALATIAVAVGIATRGREVLVFIRTNGDVVVAAADGTRPRVIQHVESPVLFTQLEWAPGGGHIALLDEAAVLRIIDSTSGAVAAERALDLGTSRFEWSPDGQRLAILDGPWVSDGDASCGGPQVHPDLEIITLDGSLDQTVEMPSGFEYTAGLGELTWSPDGRQLAIAGSIRACQHDGTYPSSIWLVDASQATVRELTSGEPTAIDFQPTWLPDGRLLFSRVLSSRADSEVIQVDPSTGATTVVLQDEDVCERCAGAAMRIEDLAPDGVRLTLKHSKVGLVVLDLRTGVSIQVAPERMGVGNLGPALWTPDGTEVLIDYGADFQAPPSVVAIDPATGRRRVLLTDTRFFDVVD